MATKKKNKKLKKKKRSKESQLDKSIKKIEYAVKKVERIDELLTFAFQGDSSRNLPGLKSIFYDDCVKSAGEAMEEAKRCRKTLVAFLNQNSKRKS